MPIDRRTAFRALAVLAVAMVTILVPALRAAAHDPIILTDEQTDPASGPLLLDGTVSFAVYGVVDAPGATRGFRLRFAAGDTFTLSALVPDLPPEQSLEGDQFPRITVTTPSGSELAPPPGPVTTFAEPFSKTNYRRYLAWSSPAEAGDYGVLITGAVPARFTVSVGTNEQFGTPVENVANRSVGVAGVQQWYATPPPVTIATAPAPTSSAAGGSGSGGDSSAVPIVVGSSVVVVVVAAVVWFLRRRARRGLSGSGPGR